MSKDSRIKILPGQVTYQWTRQEFYDHVESVLDLTESYKGSEHSITKNKCSYTLRRADGEFVVNFESKKEALEAFLILDPMPTVGEG